MPHTKISFTKNREPFAFMRTARQAVLKYMVVQGYVERATFPEDNISILWFSTDGDRWSVVLGTNLNDGLFYRIGYDGVESKLSVFKMWDSQIIEQEED